MFRWYLGKAIRRGRLVLIESNGRATEFGPKGDGPPLTIRLRDARTLMQLSLNPELTFGEAYMEGAMTVENGTIRDVMGADLR